MSSDNFNVEEQRQTYAEENSGMSPVLVVVIVLLVAILLAGIGGGIYCLWSYVKYGKVISLAEAKLQDALAAAKQSNPNLFKPMPIPSTWTVSETNTGSILERDIWSPLDSFFESRTLGELANRGYSFFNEWSAIQARLRAVSRIINKWKDYQSVPDETVIVMLSIVEIVKKLNGYDNVDQMSADDQLRFIQDLLTIEQYASRLNMYYNSYIIYDSSQIIAIQAAVASKCQNDMGNITRGTIYQIAFKAVDEFVNKVFDPTARNRVVSSVIAGGDTYQTVRDLVDKDDSTVKNEELKRRTLAVIRAIMFDLRSEIFAAVGTTATSKIIMGYEFQNAEPLHARNAADILAAIITLNFHNIMLQVSNSSNTNTCFSGSEKNSQLTTSTDVRGILLNALTGDATGSTVVTPVYQALATKFTSGINADNLYLTAPIFFEATRVPNMTLIRSKDAALVQEVAKF